MATNKPRIQISLRPEHYDVITRIARLHRQSRSAVIAELVEQVVPVFERVAVLAEAAQRAQVQAKEGFRESLERAEQAILPAATLALDQLDLLLDDAMKQQAAAPQGGGRGEARAERRDDSASPRNSREASPRPVTRGPGRGVRRGSAKGKAPLRSKSGRVRR